MNFTQNTAAILRIVAAANDRGAQLSDIIQGTGLSRPAAQRMLGILIDERAIERDTSSLAYVLSGALAAPVAACFEPWLGAGSVLAEQNHPRHGVSGHAPRQ